MRSINEEPAWVSRWSGYALAAPLDTEGQSTRKPPRIGILRPGSPPDPLLEAFRQGVRELGYDEGRNLSIEYRWAEDRADRFPSLAAELVRLKVDAIVAGAGAVEAVKQVTHVIPIGMPNTAGDPVRRGLVTSLARPGGNITGLTSQSGELPGKSPIPPITPPAILLSVLR
jgi:ABC-type uncharacterized transport system substrate-binding protein